MKDNTDYESPEFEFQEMKLVERVADTCWGFGYGWFDIDKDGVHDPTEEIIRFEEITNGSGKCNAVADALVGHLKSRYRMQIARDEVKENSNSKLVKPIVS